MKPLLLLATIALLTFPNGAEAKRVKIASTSASSTYPDEAGISYQPAKAVDSKLSTAWVEGDEGSGLGSWLELDLGGTTTVHKLKIWGGLWYSREYWERANRPKEIEVRWSDDTTETFTLTDEMVVQELTPASPKSTSSVKIKVKGVYSGNTWLDTAIAEVQVLDGEDEAFAPVREVTASSVAPADADGSYDASNVTDGMSDSMWCEGKADGDGVGETLEFAFRGTHDVSELHLVNGIGSSMPFWMKGNRAAKATLTFSDGSTHDIAVKNTMLPQTVEFPKQSTSSVKITFTEIVKGKEFNDLCISEASFE